MDQTLTTINNNNNYYNYYKNVHNMWYMDNVTVQLYN